jgi:hypothetical protein
MTRLLIGLTGGLYRFDLDAGGGPGAVLPGVQPMAFAMDPGEPARAYCATYNRGLWRSEDAGETWLPVGTPQGFLGGRPAVRLSCARQPSCRSIPFRRQMAGMLFGSARSRAAYTVPPIMATRSNSCPLSTCLPARAGPFLHGRGLTMSSASPAPATVAAPGYRGGRHDSLPR